MAEPKKRKLRYKEIKPQEGYSEVDKRIYDAVGPYMYSGFIGGIGAYNRIRKGKGYGRPASGTSDPWFDEIFQYALGKDEDPSNMKYWEKSPYKPSVATDKNSEYIRMAGIDKDQLIYDNRKFIGDPKQTSKQAYSSELAEEGGNKGPVYTLGRYKLSKGEDEKGKYISMYDIWDLRNKRANAFLDRKPEIYDRVYYEEKDGDIVRKRENFKTGGIVAKKKPNGGQVGVKNNKLKANYGVGTPLREIFNLPADATEQEKLMSIRALKNAQNQTRWANFQGKWTDYPEGRDVPVFKYTPAIMAEMEKRGLNRDYIESWQPSNYPQKFGLGGDILGGATTGASVGSAVPVVGTAVGAVVGGLGGMFTSEDFEGSEAWRAKQVADLRAKGSPVRQGENPAIFGIDPGTYHGMTADQQVSNQYTPTFPMGGLIPYDDVPVELENDEVFRKPGDSKIYEVDGKYHSQGGEDFTLPEGTEILGKTVNPVTGNTFKQDGMKLKKTQDRINKNKSRPGTIGETTNKMKLARIDNEYNNLFAAQEMCKGGKVKRKMADGGKVEKMPLGGWLSSNPYMLDWMGGSWNTLQNTGYSPSITPDVLPSNLSGALGVGAPLQNQGAGLTFGQKVGNWTNKQGGLGGLFNTAMQLAPLAYNLVQGSKPAEHLKASDYYNPEYSRSMGKYDRAIDLMANRRFDIDPMLEANRNAQAIADYNARTQGGLSAGAVTSNRLASMAQRMRGDQRAYAQQQNMNNQYAAQHAGMLGSAAQFGAGLGQQQAMMDFNVANINQQADAARRGYLGQGFSDLSEYAQRQQLMQNQQQRDKDLLGIYPDMFGSVYPYMGGMQDIYNRYNV